MKQNYTKEIDSIEDKKIHLRESLERYFFHWRWFILGLLTTLLGAFLFLRYTTPVFEVVSTVLVQDKNNKTITSDLSAFEDLGLASNSTSYFNTEIGILKSRSLMEKVVKKLGIHKKYIQKGRFRNKELFGNNLPFKINFFGKDSLIYKKDTLLSIIPTSTTNFDLYNAKEVKTGSYSFGENVNSEIADFTVLPTTLTPIDINEKVMIYITPVETVANYYRFKVNINHVNEKSTLIDMTLRDVNKEKASAILSVLLEQYNIEAIIGKSLVAKNTGIFINERIDAISEELDRADKDVERFKTSNNLTDIDSESNLILKSNNTLEKETVDLNTQLKLANYVIEYVSSNKNELIPTNLGLKGVSLNQISLRYNKIVLERDRLMQSSNPLNPVIVNLESQIANLRTSILQSLNNLKSSFTISLNDLKNQESRINSKITSVPKKERQYRDIQRSQQIIETLYLYLLQKREENAISLAVKAPNAKIIDPAFGSLTPVFPKKIYILFFACLVGIAIPFIGIYLYYLFNNNVQTTEDIETALDAPILGDIPISKKIDGFLEADNSKNEIMEAFRIIRTNMFFILSKNKKACKNIFISSTFKGEGKSFTSIYLAKTLAIASKKVVLIGADIRNPKISDYLDIENKHGLTHFLADNTIKPTSIIERLSVLNFDLIQGGVVPANPSELLMNGRFDELLSYVNKHYEYVIIDTAPVNMVTDTVMLSQDKADMFIYVVRANYLDKRMLKIPKKLYETNKLQNIAMVLNYSNPKGAYGYGYGYGYTPTKKPWWKRG